MNAAHTPGPWVVRQFDRKQYVTDTTPDREGRFVGQVIANQTTAPATLANLQLISAAPDLLAASKAMLAYLHDHRLPDAFVTHYDAMRAAIAKAEGREATP